MCNKYFECKEQCVVEQLNSFWFFNVALLHLLQGHCIVLEEYKPMIVQLKSLPSNMRHPGSSALLWEVTSAEKTKQSETCIHFWRICTTTKGPRGVPHLSHTLLLHTVLVSLAAPCILWHTCLAQAHHKSGSLFPWFWAFQKHVHTGSIPLDQRKNMKASACQHQFWNSWVEKMLKIQLKDAQYFVMYKLSFCANCGLWKGTRTTCAQDRTVRPKIEYQNKTRGTSCTLLEFQCHGTRKPRWKLGCIYYLGVTNTWINTTHGGCCLWSELMLLDIQTADPQSTRAVLLSQCYCKHPHL